MGFMDSVKAFLHSVTTDDHYALYGSPYENSSAGGSMGSQPNSSSLRLQELNNSLSQSLVSSRNGSSTNIGGYRPGMRSSSTNVNTVGGAHEMQTFGADGQPPLPSIDSLWDRIEAFLEEEYPELEDSLNSGASSADLNEFEKDLAVGPLPVEVRQFYKRHDGQFRGGKPTGLLMGLTLLDMESIMEEYYIWAKVAEKVERQRLALQHQKLQIANGESTSASQASQERISNSYLMHQKSIPADAVQPYYVHRGWVPIARDYVGNMVALDLAPGPAGNRGQIILYGREFDTKVVIASNLQELLFNYVTDLETGNYLIDKSESYDDNGFLDSSRTDDYMIGDEDEDNGELSFFDRDGAEFGKNNKNKLSYIDVLKRRALARFGITRNENFQTTFTPQRIPKKHSQSPTGSNAQRSSTSRNGSTSHLANVESASDLLKETLIGADSKTEKKETPSKNEPAVENPPVKSTPVEHIKKEVTKPETKSTPAKETISEAPAKKVEPKPESKKATPASETAEKKPEAETVKEPKQSSADVPKEEAESKPTPAKSANEAKDLVEDDGHTEIEL